MKAVDFFRKMNEVERCLHAAERKVELFKSLAEAKDGLRKLRDTYFSLVDMITDRMTRLEDPEDEKLLAYHYLEHTPLTSVALRMHRGKTWVYQRHGVALERLDRLLKDL